jgi:hypothetical protein
MARRHRDPFRRTRYGTYQVGLPDHILDILGQLLQEYRSLLTHGGDGPRHPLLHRLFPTAYHQNAELDTEYQRLMGDELLASKLQALDDVEASLHHDELSENELMSWMLTLNSLRLIIGTRLDVDEDTPLDGPDDADDAERELHRVYWLLGSLVELIVEVQLH